MGVIDDFLFRERLAAVFFLAIDNPVWLNIVPLDKEKRAKIRRPCIVHKPPYPRTRLTTIIAVASSNLLDHLLSRSRAGCAFCTLGAGCRDAFFAAFLRVGAGAQDLLRHRRWCAHPCASCLAASRADFMRSSTASVSSKSTSASSSSG
jgi:hypothetical protein